MALRWYYRNDAGDIEEIVDRVRTGTMDLVTNAEEGTVGSSTMRVDDTTGDFSVVGHRRVYVMEDSINAAADVAGGVVWMGFSADRVIERGEETVDDARSWEIALVDLNAVLERRMFTTADANRPAETDLARIAWLFTQTELRAFVDDDTYVSATGAVNMDATDYRKQRVRDVLDDCAQQSGKNWFVVQLASGVADPVLLGLFYDFDSAAVFSSSAKITNDPALIDPANLILPPAQETRLRRDPSRVYSGVIVDYDGGWVYVTRPETATTFSIGGRDTTMSAPNVKTAATARARGRRYLRDLATEEDIITTAVRVRGDDLNCILAGQRVECKFTHLPGYQAGYVWLRAVTRTIREIGPDDYEIALELTTDSPATGGSCSGLTASGSFYPLGGSGNTPNASPTGNVIYWRPGIGYPTEVTPGHEGIWHFPQYGAGGAGTTDYAGDCAQNRVRCIVVGDGTMVIHTATFSGSSRTLQARLMHQNNGADVVDEVQTVTTGSDFTFTVSTHGGVNCTHYVDVTDAGGSCGGKWGFQGFDWTADA